ncbi:MAG: hypothetical protein MUP81_06460 [Dehalococcoidia bacterium]|nr:hypothetical protein [Dehalococcoidia bacterium]
MPVNIEAFVCVISSNRAGDRSELAAITATYEAASTASSITFHVPISQAKHFFVGQKLTISVTWAEL